MANEVSVVIHWKNLDDDQEVQDHLRERCGHLASEFPETDRYELTLEGDAGGIEGHCHVTGKKTSVAARISNGENPRQTGDQLLDKLERELRKDHDKRIFAPRRKAQKNRGKRTA
jgi:ribosome-associated translation inhibitor RaiA